MEDCPLARKRPREPAAATSAVHLRWTSRAPGARGDALRLESFELVEAQSVGHPQPASQLSIEAAALLASLTALPPHLVVTATVPLDLSGPERDALLPLTPSAAQSCLLDEEASHPPLGYVA